MKLPPNPRLIFEGDPTAALPFAGIAKKWARQTYQSGVRARTYLLGDAQIRIENYPESYLSKVFIRAGGFSFYQFYCTSPVVSQVPNTLDASSLNSPGGSFVWVKTPSGDTAKGLPYGSLIQEPPEEGDWRYVAMPSTLSELAQAMEEVTPATNAWQINGLPEQVYYLTNNGKVSHSLVNAWVQTDGRTVYLGAKSPGLRSYHWDYLYDVTPGLVKKGFIAKQAPDSDWPGRACLQKVTSEEFGSRLFVIYQTAENRWHCWPLLRVDQLDYSITENAPPEYLAQAYKSNVPPEYARSVMPEYPAWVYRTDGMFRDLYIERDNVNPLDPRYNWSFNSTGTRAICCLVEREPAGLFWDYIDYNESPPTEKTSTNPVNIRAETPPTQPAVEEVQIDRLGLVELGFTIQLTGENLEDFTFSVSVLRDEPPSDEAPLRTAVAYAAPVDWEKTPLAGQVTKDAIIESWFWLYRHTDERKFILANDGEMGSEFPTKAKITITVNGAPLLEIPVTQLNGRTYGSRGQEDTSNYDEFHTAINDVDLSTLSFFLNAQGRKTTIDETPISSQTVNGLLRRSYVKRARCGLVFRAIVFGQVEVEERLGEFTDELAEFLDEPLELTGEDELLAVGDKTTLRGVFGATYQPPWWLKQRCRDAVMREMHRRVYAQYYWTTDDDDRAAANPGVLDYQKGVGLLSINEGNFVAEFVSRIIAQSYEGPPNGPTSWSTELVHKNTVPFFAANTNFSVEHWEEEVSWILWKVFVDTRTILSTQYGNLVNINSRPTVANAVDAAMMQYTGITRSNYARLDSGSLNRLVVDGVVRNYPSGVIWYQRRDPFGWFQGTHSKIITHPKGHYSLYARRCYVFTTEYPILLVWLTDIGKFFQTFATNVGDYINTYAFSKKLVDRVSWNHNTTVSSHLALYNEAFQKTDTPSQYMSEILAFVTATNEIFYGDDGEAFPINWFFTETQPKTHAQGAFIYEPTQTMRSHVRLSPLFVG